MRRHVALALCGKGSPSAPVADKGRRQLLQRLRAFGERAQPELQTHSSRDIFGATSSERRSTRRRRWCSGSRAPHRPHGVDEHPRGVLSTFKRSAEYVQGPSRPSLRASGSGGATDSDRNGHGQVLRGHGLGQERPRPSTTRSGCTRDAVFWLHSGAVIKCHPTERQRADLVFDEGNDAAHARRRGGHAGPEESPGSSSPAPRPPAAQGPLAPKTHASSFTS